MTVDDDGKTRIKERYIVSSPLGGRLDRIELDPGDPVVAGETLLATIEPNEPELLDPRARALAEARVKAAEASLARAEPLVERLRAELAFAESNLGTQSGAGPDQCRLRRTAGRSRNAAPRRAQDYRSATFARDVAPF